MATPTVYVICDQNCKFESMTKEQIIAAIAEATGNAVTNVDDAFITKIKEQNAGESIKLWVGSQGKYNELAANDMLDTNTIYCTSDNSAVSVLNGVVARHDERIGESERRIFYNEQALESHDERLETLEASSGSFSGTLEITNGGTGATTAVKARANLGAAAASHTHNAKDIKGALPITNGGTGATTAVKALENLGFRFHSQAATINAVGTTYIQFDTTKEPLHIFAPTLSTDEWDKYVNAYLVQVHCQKTYLSYTEKKYTITVIYRCDDDVEDIKERNPTISIAWLEAIE